MLIICTYESLLWMNQGSDAGLHVFNLCKRHWYIFLKLYRLGKYTIFANTETVANILCQIDSLSHH